MKNQIKLSREELRNVSVGKKTSFTLDDESNNNL
jgi:hypothetical protein